jgi:hypothetical protein
VEFEGLLEDRHVVLLVSTDSEANKVFLSAKKCFCIFAHCLPADECVDSGLSILNKKSIENHIQNFSKHTGYICAKNGISFGHGDINKIMTLLYTPAEEGEAINEKYILESILSNPYYGDGIERLGEIELNLDGHLKQPTLYAMDNHNTLHWLQMEGLTNLGCIDSNKCTGLDLGLFYLYQDAYTDAFADATPEEMREKFDRAYDKTIDIKSMKPSDYRFAEKYLQRHPEQSSANQLTKGLDDSSLRSGM